MSERTCAQPPTTASTTSGNARSAAKHRRASGGDRAGARTASKNAVSAPKKYKGEVFLVMSLVVSGRSPLNGWIVSLGAALIAAEHRRVLGLFERNLLPLSSHFRVEPVSDVVGFLRRQRPELEFMLRSPSAPMEVMADLGRFCAPYSNLSLVGSPLMSVHGWLTYYWSAYQQHVVDLSSASAPPGMPWGFSGLCARSYAAGCLGVPMKQLLKDARYQQTSEGFQAVGLPLADALAAAASFSYIYWQQQQQKPLGENAVCAEAHARVPPLTFDIPVPEHLIELGCVPLSACPANAQLPSEPSPPHTLLDRLVDIRIRRGLARHAPPMSPPKSPVSPSGRPASASPASFPEYPSITSLEFHPDFQAHLPKVLREEETWVATEKVHGSNFTIFCDGTDIWAGRRTSWLGLRDSPAFFNFVYLLEEARPAILACYALVNNWVRARSPEDGQVEPLVVSVTCELAGGDYPHPRVPVDLRATRVQSGVFYSNRNFLYGFDIGVEAIATAAPSLAAALQTELHACMIRTQKTDSSGDGVSRRNEAPPTATFLPWGPDGRYYLPFPEAEAIFKASGFPTYATARCTGSLKAIQAAGAGLCIFSSAIARDWFDFPELPDNMAEGVVLRPTRDWWMRSEQTEAEEDEAGGAWSRVMIKVKHPRFSEFSHKHPPSSATLSAANRADTCVAEESNETIANITDFLTEARVSAVLSKHTLEEQRDTAMMAKAVLADAIKDAEALQRHSKRRPSMA